MTPAAAIRYLATFLIYIVMTPAAANETDAMAEVLASNPPPAGVVFEIVGGDARSLNTAIERAQRHIQKLRTKFPSIRVVVVSHGLEQFSLLQDRQADHPDLHQRVRRLVNDEGVPLQVCGAFADMTGVDSKQFIQDVQVLDAAPVQIEDYRARGYVVIEMEN